MKRFIKYFLPVAIVVAFTAALYAHADSSGPNAPTSAVDNGATGTVAWSNPTNVEADDGVFASPGSVSALTHYLNASGYNFSIPSNATVNGIQVDVVRKAALSGVGNLCPGGINTVCDINAVLITSSGALGTTNEASTTPWAAAIATSTYGGPSDLWGASWAPSDINSSNFGFAISVNSHGMTGPSCLAQGTLVLTTHGEVPIEKLKAGEQIWSYSTTTKKMEKDTVVWVQSEPIVDDGNLLYDITTSDHQTIKATASHMFFANGDWVVAPNLKVGDVLLDAKLKKVHITKIVKEKQPGTRVWNISVKKNQNFFAGNTLVHNASTNTASIDYIQITVTFSTPSISTGTVVIQSHTVIQGGNVTFK